MMGLDKMLAAMTGMTPAEMQAMAKGLTGAAEEAVQLLRKLEAGMVALDKRMEALENGGRK